MSPLLDWLFKTSKNMCQSPSTLTMNGSATKRAGTSVTSSAEMTGLEAPGAAAMRRGDAPEYMAMDHVHGRLASFDRPMAFGSMVSMVKPNFINMLASTAPNARDVRVGPIQNRNSFRDLTY